jgi:hypothetical protein
MYPVILTEVLWEAEQFFFVGGCHVQC